MLSNKLSVKWKTGWMLGWMVNFKAYMHKQDVTNKKEQFKYISLATHIGLVMSLHAVTIKVFFTPKWNSALIYGFQNPYEVFCGT